MVTSKKRKRRRRPAPNASTQFPCPHCGELIGTWPDPGGGERQTYIEDCAVCCRPISITAVLDESGRDFTIDVAPEE